MRGDHQLNEAKFAAAVAGKQSRPMHAEEIQELFGSPAGFLGPVGIDWARDIKDLGRPVLLVDKALEGRKNLISGANKEDYHLQNVTPGHDFQPTAYADLRTVTAGEACPNCGSRFASARPSRSDTSSSWATSTRSPWARGCSTRNGKEVTPIMGSYGIGIERILTAAIEQNNDENGFWLPPQIAPFEIVVTPTNVGDEKIKKRPKTSPSGWKPQVLMCY